MRLSLKRRPAPAKPSPPPGHKAPENLPEYVPVESDDPLAEISQLMEENRSAPDAKREKRLVQLRHEAFGRLREQALAGQGPALDQAEPTRDLTGPSGLPEIDATDLDPDALRDGILGGGSLIIRGLATPDRVERMREGIDQAFAKRDAYIGGEPVSETTPWFDPFAPRPEYPLDAAQWNRMKAGGHAAWAPDSPRMMFELLDTFDTSGVTELITTYLGERPALSMNKSVLRRVPPTSGTDWHQDGAFLGRGIRTCNVWIALSRCGDEAPGLDLVPKRFDEIVETGTEGAVFKWSVAQSVVERVAGEAGIVRPIFEAGDAVLFDHYCLHRTAVDPAMTKDRYATETWCFAPSVYPEKTIPLVL